VLSDWKEDSYNFYTSVQEVVVMQNWRNRVCKQSGSEILGNR
jgi:hypothetical protein